MNKTRKTLVLSLLAMILVSLFSSIAFPVQVDSQAPAGFTDTPTPANTPIPPTDTSVPPPTDTPAPPPTDTSAPPPTDTPAPSTPKPKKTRRAAEDTPVPTSSAETPTPTVSVTAGLPITGMPIRVTSLVGLGIVGVLLGIGVIVSRRLRA